MSIPQTSTSYIGVPFFPHKRIFLKLFFQKCALKQNTICRRMLKKIQSLLWQWFVVISFFMEVLLWIKLTVWLRRFLRSWWIKGITMKCISWASCCSPVINSHFNLRFCGQGNLSFLFKKEFHKKIFDKHCRLFGYFSRVTPCPQ